MIKLKLRSTQAVLMAAVAFLLTPLSALAATPSSSAKSIPKPPCRVDMPLAHESTSYAEKHRVLAVKVNVIVNCDKLITHLTLHVDLFKKAFPTPIFLEPFDFNENVRILPGHPFKVSGPVFTCENWKPTAFFSEVSSTAVINGEKLTAPKRRSFSKIIACGN